VLACSVHNVRGTSKFFFETEEIERREEPEEERESEKRGTKRQKSEPRKFSLSSLLLR